MNGVLVVDKPAGMTSHDVIDVVRGKLGTKKVGHAGTLDPDATGVLLIGVGRATRFLSYAQAAPKRYTAVAAFGSSTSTQDASGEVLETSGARPTREELELALDKFTGPIEQLPPMVSAVKVGGERLYRKARRGEEIERRPRPVTIYALRLNDFDGDTATLDVECSAGTYVRTLVHDLGTTLGSFAHLKSLRRTEAGGFTEDETTLLDAVTEHSLRPIADVVRVLRRVEVDPEVVEDISHGKRLPRHPDVPDGESVALLHGGDLLGVYRARDDALVPDRVMAS